MKRLGPILFIVTLAFSLCASLVSSGQGWAAPNQSGGGSGATYTFQDRTTIIVDYPGIGNNIQFVDSNIWDGTNGYKPPISNSPSANSFCDKGIQGTIGVVIPNNADWSAISINGTLNIGTWSGFSCKPLKASVAVTNPNQVANAKFTWNGNDIQVEGGGQQSFGRLSSEPSDSKAYYTSQTNGDCPQAVLLVDQNDNNKATIYNLRVASGGRGGSGGSTPPSSLNVQSDCVVSSSRSVNIAGSPGTTAPGASGSGGSSSGGPPTCEASGFSLSWILCPIIDGLAHAVDGIYSGLVQPLLKTQPIELSNPGKDPTNTYKIWSNFRIYGDIFLVIALLVLVFGESIGGGMIDAYTAKKILPRLLIAAVLINLSIYLVALAVDITNVVGNGVEALIEGPFKNAGAFKLHIGGAAGDVGMGALLGSAGLIWKLSLAPALLEFLAFVVVLPAFLTFIAILVTVILRRGLILFLILISPVAFALYCLPNTEQYFRKWWDLLLRTLIVYPIIAAAFAIGNVLSVTMSSTSSGLIDGTLAQLLGIIALFVPLLLIPYSFRLAGGFLGRAHDAVTSVRDRAHKATEGRRQRAQSHLTRASIQGRQNWYSTLQDSASRGGAFRRRGLGGLARAVGGYNIEARSSAANAEIGKEFNDIIATGKDDEIRGVSVDKRYAQSRTTSDGRKQFKSLGGAWINEADVDAGHRRWGGNAYAMQASLAYEMRKADTEQDVQRIASDYHNVAQANGLTDQQAAGAWIGAAFQNQDKHLQFKYTNWQTGQMDADQRESFMSEIYEKRGSYNMAQMHAGTIGQVIQANRDAQAVIANSPTGLTGQARQDEIDQAKRMQGQAASIAESFVSRWGGGSGIGGEGAELAATMQQQAAAAAAVQQQVAQGPATGTQQAGPQIPASVARGAVNLGQPRAAGGLGPTVQTNTPGAAHVAERVRQLAVETGVYQTLDPSSDTRPSQGPPPISRQN